MKKNEVTLKTREGLNSFILTSFLGLSVGSILGFFSCSQNMEILKGIWR